MSMLRRFAYKTITSPYVIVITGSVIALLLVATCIVVLLETREDAIARASENARNLGVIAEQDIERNLELYGLSLQAIVDGLKDPDVMNLPWKLRHAVLFDHAITASYLGAALVLDADGNVIVDSSSEVPRKGNFASRPYFTEQRDHPDLGMYISHPFMPVLRHTPSIALSRRVSNPDGSFAGVVVMSLDLDYFRQLFSSLKLGPLGAVALISQDGTMYMRHPYSEKIIGMDLMGASSFRHFLLSPEGTFFDTSTIDGTSRLYYYKHFSSLPFYIMIAQGVPDIYAEWWHRAVRIAALTATLAAGFIMLSLLMSIQLQRRLRAEEKLLLLARTDGLTGLNNRRTLDEILEHEWARARRVRSVFSLLFIDIDRFKSYNDTYGHQSGDNALAIVAQLIEASIRRPGDSAARYGGEEFVVVLPDTSLEGAAVIAEKIRAGISAQAVENSGSEYGHVTVSIGVAASAPERGTDVAGILNAADEALHQAKSTGRNKVVLA